MICFSLTRHKNILHMQIGPCSPDLWRSSSLLFQKRCWIVKENQCLAIFSIVVVDHGEGQSTLFCRSAEKMTWVPLDTIFLVRGIWEVQIYWPETTLFQIGAAAHWDGYFNYVFQGTAERFVFYIGFVFYTICSYYRCMSFQHLIKYSP